MRWFLLVAMLAGCGGESCPSHLSLSCSQDQTGLVCDEQLEDTTATCRCNGATWTCTDCPDGELPTTACAPGATCAVWGFENACGCSCDADGAWHCAVDDPDPNFHCSF